MASVDVNAAIDRIKKLMAVATGHGATEAEVETYMAKARAMMDQFNLEEADLYSSAEKEKTAYEQQVHERGFSRSGSLWEGDRVLANAVAIVCDVGIFVGKRNADDKGAPYHSTRGGKVTYQIREFVFFYGMPRDVAVAKALFVELKAAGDTMAAVRGYPTSGMSAGFRSYFLGFVTRLFSRALEQKRESTAAADTTAIVLRKDVLRKRYAEERLSLGKSRRRGSSIGDGGAYAKGSADGAAVSLGTNQVGQRGQGRIGQP